VDVIEVISGKLINNNW